MVLKLKLKNHLKQIHIICKTEETPFSLVLSRNIEKDLDWKKKKFHIVDLKEKLKTMKTIGHIQLKQVEKFDFYFILIEIYSGYIFIIFIRRF